MDVDIVSVCTDSSQSSLRSENEGQEGQSRRGAVLLSMEHDGGGDGDDSVCRWTGEEGGCRVGTKGRKKRVAEGLSCS